MQGQQPLQPLVYTEDPDHTPKAAAVREGRLMRRLLEGASGDGADWGTLEAKPHAGLPKLNSAENLGRVLFEALVGQDDRRWDYLFVRPGDYAGLVQVKLEKAREFVDRQQGDAREARRRFHIEKASEAPKEGLESIFEFRALELGEGRTAGGSIAGEEDIVAQHWDNILRFGLKEGDVEFRLRIPKILRIHPPGQGMSKGGRLGVASDIHIGPRLGVYLDAGMHLKPELLRSFEYPVPLKVGNFWRYARRLDGAKPERPSPIDRPKTESKLRATHVTMRVESVDRYGTRRLVHLRFVYNDADLTRSSERWLVTPRQVFRCPRPCRRHIQDLSWLLSYLKRQTPLFEFPILRGKSWGGGAADSEPTFRVSETWQNLEVPAGSFFGTFSIDGLGPLQDRVPFHSISEMNRFFAPSKGIVRREYQFGEGGKHTVVESLVDYRIMPR